MKKITLYILCALFTRTACTIISNAHADDSTSSFKKVYLIKVYEKDPWMGNYILLQLGSAVAVDEHTLVTNAHVILNSANQEAYKNIEVCETTSIKKTPRCFGTANIINYDTDRDLALLSTNKKLTVSSLSSSEPQLKQKVSVIGYPNNGGSTITTTQGTIAGYEDGYYKIDANIDHGNSGGGSYNELGELVGIPVFYIDGGNALGYMIPASTVKSFLKENKGSQTLTSPDSTFKQVLVQTQTAIKKQVITNPFFTIKLKNSGFELITEYKDAKTGVASYLLKHKDNKSYLTIDVAASDDNEFDVGGEVIFMKKMENQFSRIIVGSGTKNGQERRSVKMYKSTYDNKSNQIDYHLNLNTTNNQVRFSMTSSSTNKQSETDLQRLFDSLQIKSAPIIQPKETIGTIVLPSAGGVVRKHYSIGSYGLGEISFDLKEKYTDSSLSLVNIEESYKQELQEKNMQSFADSIKESIENDYKGTIKKEGFVQSADSKSQWYIVVFECPLCEVHRIRAYSFVTNPQDHELYLATIGFEHDLSTIEAIDVKNILHYLSQIKLNSTLPYKTDGISRQSFDTFAQ